MAKQKTRKRPRIQCVYIEGFRQCSRVGYGDPPLCRVHELVVEEEEYDELDLLDDILERVNDGAERLADKIRGFFDQRQIPVPPVVQQQPRPRRPQQQQQQHQQRRPPPPPPPAQQQARREDPRLVLGFPPELKLTKDMIRDRKRQLAAVFHPDKPGGSVEAMKRVNTAADALLKKLG